MRAAVDGSLEIAPSERRLVPTGFAVELPRGWEGQVDELAPTPRDAGGFGSTGSA